MNKLDEIKKFRKEMKGHCVSTSHSVTAIELELILPQLLKEFEEVYIDKRKSIPGITITIFNH